MTSESINPNRLTGLGWLLDNLAEQVGHHTRAVLASLDGITRSSSGLSMDDAQRIGALGSSFHASSRSAAGVLGADNSETAVRQFFLEHSEFLLFVMSAGSGTLLTVITDTEANAGTVGHEMGLIGKRLGEQLATPSRAPLAAGERGVTHER
ncbi:roadblock/LC7 domain-containing protein [Streptomyces amakusaensis]|uniref:Roadblock/LC7 domain-containing protein n=1 Tax=Streptomyces amakusaensis TaxID=67271 RepID=A0ABW0ANE9_9ACTN